MFYFIPRKNLKKIGYSRMIADGKSVKDLKDSFYAIKLLKLHNIVNFFTDKFSKSKKIAAYTDSKRQFINSLPGIWIQLIFVLSIMIIILFSINYSLLNQKDLIIKLGIFSLIFFRSFPSFNKLIHSLQFLKYSEKFVDRYMKHKPADKLKMQDHAHASHDNFKKHVE